MRGSPLSSIEVRAGRTRSGPPVLRRRSGGRDGQPAGAGVLCRGTGPHTVLLDLSAAGFLGARSGPGDDDDYCWALNSPLEWDGATFGGLCVVTDDPEAVSAHPEFFWSASLAPWTEVWLTSTIAPAALDRWARENLPAASRYEIDPLDAAEGTGALSCSEWHFPLPG